MKGWCTHRMPSSHRRLVHRNGLESSMLNSFVRRRRGCRSDEHIDDIEWVCSRGKIVRSRGT